MRLPRRLIVNADDFGLHPSINAAIARGHRSGIITSASLMPFPENAPAFHDAVALARDLPELGIGLHFTLVGAPGLPEGYGAFVQALASSRFPSSRIETLLRRQLDALAMHGILPDHLDSHQHLHVLPSVFRAVCRVLPDYGIRAVRIPYDPGPYFGASRGRIAAARVLGLFALRAAREARRNELWLPDHFRGMAVSGHLTPQMTRGLIENLPTGVTEILCHPGTDNRKLTKAYDWGYDWEGELAAVTDRGVCDAVRTDNLQLTTFVKESHLARR